jgi:ribosomal protein L7/L12
LRFFRIDAEGTNLADSISDADLERIRGAIATGKKIEAIKLYREASGAGLAEAKHAVESLESSGTLDGPALGMASTNEAEQIQAALFAGRKILAIKLYRAQTGLGLIEAKEFIDSLEAELRRTEPEKFTAPPAKGCGVAVLMIAIAAVVLVEFAFA